MILRPFSFGDEETVNATFNEVFGQTRSLEEWYWKFGAKAEPRVLWLLSPSPLGVPAAGLFAGSKPPWEGLADVLNAYQDTQFYLAALEPTRRRWLGMWSLA